MACFLTGLFSFLGTFLSVFVVYILYRRDKYKQLIYERKVAVYKEMGVYLARIDRLLNELFTAVFFEKKGKCYEEIFESKDFCGAVFELYLFCYQNSFVISGMVMREVFELMSLCTEKKLRRNPKLHIRAISKRLHNLVNVIRQDIGVEKLSEGIFKEIYRFP